MFKLKVPTHAITNTCVVDIQGGPKK